MNYMFVTNFLSLEKFVNCLLVRMERYLFSTAFTKISHRLRTGLEPELRKSAL